MACPYRFSVVSHDTRCRSISSGSTSRVGAAELIECGYCKGSTLARDCPKVYAYARITFMRNWMRDRLMRRKKKDGDAEKASSEQPKQAPLQPDFYDAQASSEAREDAQPGNLRDDAQDGVQDNVREAAPSRPLP